MADKKTRRGTRQRQVVLDELRNTMSHPTAIEVFETARRRLPKLSLATVYRNLERLAADGVIRKLQTSGRESRFDGNPQRHYHVRCVRCGRVDDAGNLPSEPIAEDAAGLNGYRILGCRLEFVGICPDCRAAAPRADEEICPDVG